MTARYAADTVGSTELMRAAGMTYRQLDYWTRRGVLFADHPTPGSGAQRVYPADEVPVACALVRLMAAGLPLDMAAELARRPIPAEGARDAVRVGRGVVLCLYPDLWQVDDLHPDDLPAPPGVATIPRQERDL